MSNFLAVATVTAVLRQVIQGALDANLPGAVQNAKVSVGRPDAAANANPRVNLYLYQVTSNGAFRNADLPTRNARGELIERPQAAMDLHYLMSFYGAETSLDPQRLLGLVVRTLHEQPLLTRGNIQKTIQDPAFDYVKDSNLADQVELVKFTPLQLSLEELSKLWSIFFQTSYALSVAYQASVVLIEADRTPQRALPVQDRNIYVVPFRHPVLEEARSDSLSPEGHFDPLVVGSTLVLTGLDLAGAITKVLIGGQEVDPKELTDTKVTLELKEPPFPAGTLRAGVQGAQIFQQIAMGTPAVAHRGLESNVAAFVLLPHIKKITPPAVGSKEMKVALEPTVGKSQRVVLLLNPTGGAGAAFTFTVPSRQNDGSEITFTLSGVTTGEYLVRVQVEGAESQLDVQRDPNLPRFNQYIGPTVQIP